VELRHYLAAVREGRKIVVVVLVLAIALGALLAIIQGARYTSTTKLFVATQVESDDPDELLQRNAIAQQRIVSYVEVINGNVFARQIAEEVGYDFDIEDVQVSVRPSTSVIQVAVVDDDADAAQEIAAAYAEAAPAVLRDLERSDEGGWEVVATVVDEADEAEPVEQRSPVLIILMAVFLGLVAGAVLAVVWWAVRRELTAERQHADP
jgi:capsular polysaccharide biosynthesis protein